MVFTPGFIILNVIVFILTFLFLKTIDKRLWLTIIISLVLTPVIYFYVAYPIINIFTDYHHEKTFDSEAWIEKPALRYEMIDHTKMAGTLVGKNKDEAEKLLGKAEWLSWDFDNNTYNQNAWNYNLGKLPGAFTSTAKQVEIIFENDTISNLVIKTIDLDKDEKATE